MLSVAASTQLVSFPSHALMSSISQVFRPLSDVDDCLFSALLDVDSAVDEAKLRRAAFSGIPPLKRPYVWRLLLGISPFDKTHDGTLEFNLKKEYAAQAHHITMDDEISRKIHRLLKRSRSLYQPVSTHDRRPSRHGSTSSDSYDAEDDDDTSSDTVPSTAHNLDTTHSPRNRKSVIRSTHQSTPSVDRTIHAKFSRVINTYLHRSDLDFDPDMLYLCAPFIEIMPTEADAYYAFCTLMDRYSYLFTVDGLRDAISEFNTIFRTLHPTLFDKFVLEEVDMKRFVRKWLRGLLVHQLPRRSLLRLWDSYFAKEDGLRLHPFVCVVFIELMKPDLEDCDDSELMTNLVGRLPPFDIDHVIAHAMTAREQLKERGVIL